MVVADGPGWRWLQRVLRPAIHPTDNGLRLHYMLSPDRINAQMMKSLVTGVSVNPVEGDRHIM